MEKDDNEHGLGSLTINFDLKRCLCAYVCGQIIRKVVVEVGGGGGGILKVHIFWLQFAVQKFFYGRSPVFYELRAMHFHAISLVFRPLPYRNFSNGPSHTSMSITEF